MDRLRINLYEFLLCLSNAQDLVSPELSNHHQKVAYLAFRLAEQLNLSNEQQKDIFLASLIHDIGALSKSDRLELIETEPITVNNHAFRGARLLKGFYPLKNASNIIKYHHLPWNYGEGKFYGGNEVPIESHIIHLADRVCVLLKNKDILSQVPNVLATIKEDAKSLYDPKLIETLLEFSNKEYIWLDLVSPSPINKVPDIGNFETFVMDMDDLIDFAFMLSQIVDFRSRFTARHSAGVAVVAKKLAELVGFSPFECKMMLVSGYLHDIGKLAIDTDLLNKPAKLKNEEYSKIKSHTYYTYQLLSAISEFETINKWASYHHERIDGRGYPFHIKGDNLTLGSRVMAVADVFTAITEDRPYRKGMDNEHAIKVLRNMVETGALDEYVVNILIENIDEINKFRERSQKSAVENYEKFISAK